MRAAAHRRTQHSYSGTPGHAPRYDGVWDRDVPRAGSYSETRPAPPGSLGSIPSVELARPDAVLADASAAAAAVGAV